MGIRLGSFSMTPASTERLIAYVEGRVQGVGFRVFVYDLACSIGVAGSVQNCPDGRVRVEAEGPRPSLDRLLQALHEGPPASRVTRVRTEWHEARGMIRFTVLPR